MKSCNSMQTARRIPVLHPIFHIAWTWHHGSSTCTTGKGMLDNWTELLAIWTQWDDLKEYYSRKACNRWWCHFEFFQQLFCKAFPSFCITFLKQALQETLTSAMNVYSSVYTDFSEISPIFATPFKRNRYYALYSLLCVVFKSKLYTGFKVSYTFYYVFLNKRIQPQRYTILWQAFTRGDSRIYFSCLLLYLFTVVRCSCIVLLLYYSFVSC